MVHKSQAGTAALRLTVLSLQAKSVSAFLGELASGKLTSPGSVLHETLRWYQLGIHTLQGQVQTLQSAPSAHELQRLLEQAQHESADLGGRESLPRKASEKQARRGKGKDSKRSPINSTSHLLVQAVLDIQKGEEIIVRYGTYYDGVYQI